MLKKFGKWTALYWPSILFTLYLAGAYLVLMGILFDVLWPLALKNGEPVYVAAMLDFRAACLQAYQALGVFALVLYALYTLNGLLSMGHAAHRRFSKECRFTVMECYMLLALKVIISLFTLPNMNNLFVIGTFMEVVTFALLALYMVRLFIYLRLKRRVFKGYWGPSANMLALGFSIALATVLTILPDALNGIINLFNLIPCLNWLNDQSAAEKYVIRLWVDGTLLLIPLLLGVFLFLLIRNASPMATCAPNGRVPRSMVYVKGLSHEEVQG